MRSMNALRRATIAAALPAVVIAGAANATAAETTAGTPAADAAATNPAADTDATGTANTAGIDADTPLNQLSSADPAALLQLGSSLLGGNRPDFSELLGGNTDAQAQAATTDGQADAGDNAGESTDSNKENLPTGINALKHEAAQLEQEASHKLFELDVIDSTHVHVGFAETYDLQKDAKALTALQETAETNGITLTADR
ncbi:TPA: hypothetical protein KEY42_002378 [Corynebacterium striatum]|uniref:hypothetical protein n=1 Tax=Corynebacterium striatum TaxID=43770 RepID=UPI001BA1C241|nr:hypothetical protein [Corynebacterium striatum]HBC7267627.1 hypothetical protein [Corynebacterium striatum]